MKHVIEWKIEGRIVVTGRWGRRGKKLLNDLKEMRGYWKLKEEALDGTVWRPGFERVCGPVARETAKWRSGDSLRVISQINPTRCTILFYIFIYFSSLHISGIHVPIIRRILLYLCDSCICHSVWVASGLLVGLKSNQKNRRNQYKVTNTSVA